MEAKAMMEEQETLESFLRHRREELGMTMREVCRLSAKNENCGRPLAQSASYYSLVETGQVDKAKISMDFFWAVGVILEVDPLKLFVLSRQDIPQRFAEGRERDMIFRIK